MMNRPSRVDDRAVRGMDLLIAVFLLLAKNQELPPPPPCQRGGMLFQTPRVLREAESPLGRWTPGETF